MSKYIDFLHSKTSLLFYFKLSIKESQRNTKDKKVPNVNSFNTFSFLNRILIQAHFALDKFDNFNDDNHGETTQENSCPLG